MQKPKGKLQKYAVLLLLVLPIMPVYAFSPIGTKEIDKTKKL